MFLCIAKIGEKGNEGETKKTSSERAEEVINRDSIVNQYTK